jgi:hypothetical protein
MIRTESDLIDALGGTTAVKALCDVRHNTVSSWRNRGFPPWAIAILRDAAGAAAIECDPALFAIKRPQRAA